MTTLTATTSLQMKMASQASQTEVVRDLAAALVHAYQGLRDEMLTMLDPGELRDEFERLFKPLEEPDPFTPVLPMESQVRLASAAEEALMRIRLIGGWIKGLINELTLSERIRAEADAKARLEAKLPPGFTK